MAKKGKKDFGAELAKVLPAILREVARSQESVLIKEKLTIPQVVVLDVLLERKACTMGELSVMLNMTMSAVTAIMDKMVRQKTARRERCSEDRRVVRVMLTKKGETTAKNIRKDRKDITNELFAVLAEKERAEYLRLIKKVYGGIIARG